MSLLWLSDSSPLFFYSPLPEYFAGTSWTASWTGSSNSAQRSVKDTSHVTTAPGAVILPSVYATSYTPIFSTGADFGVSLAVGTGEMQPWLSGQNYSDFSDFKVQTFTIGTECITGQCAQAGMGFRGAWVGTHMSPPGSTQVFAQLDDASPLVTYQGFAPIGQVAEGIAVGPLDTAGTLSMTHTVGASASVTFNGAAIVVYGVTGPTLGLFTVTLDGSIVATLNASNTVEAHGVILFYTTNLNTAATHTLVMTAAGEGTIGLVLDSWIVYGQEGGVGFSGVINGATTTVGPGSSSAPTGVFPVPSNGTTAGVPPATGGGSPNAGVIVGALLGALAGLFLLLWLFRRHVAAKKKPDKKLDPWDEANLLQNMKNEEIHVTTVAKQRYVYPGLIAHSELKR